MVGSSQIIQDLRRRAKQSCSGWQNAVRKNASRIRKAMGFAGHVCHDLPRSGLRTSRNVLGLILATAEAPRVIEYPKTPPSREELEGLINRMGISVRDVLRRKGTPYADLKLDEGARRAWLLTTSAAAFFQKAGFKVMPREQAPSAILATREAASLCPASSILLSRAISI
jgi:arsenate reductase-like glutaredoxin family protein